MKVIFVALFALLAVASAEPDVVLPSALGYSYSPYAALGSPYAALGSPYAALASPYGALGSPYAAVGSPYAALQYPSPLVAPLSYSYTAAPVAYAAAPAVQSGYVAATRGSLHTAPLPEGPLAFSHHINTAPAPGTL